ncbi:MAG: DUF2490 domain-containing protein [Bacteroidia bacterium]|jgi:hypothetical protein|nr:DUF2490 domain-containing protein [Bacteroidia bacterium]
MKRISSFLPCLFLTVLSLGFLRPLHAQNSSLGSWNIFQVKYGITDKLSLFGEAQLRSLRFYTHFHYYEYKGGIEYKPLPGLRLALGAGDYDTYREGGNFVTPKNNDEFRLWPQIQLSQTLGKFKIEQRYRAEFRFTSNGYRNRFRYRLALLYPFGKEKNGFTPFQLSVSNELFFTNREPYFERNRLAFNFNYRLSKQLSFMAGYLHQFDYRINDETGRDFLQLGIYIELKRNSAAKKQ